MRSKLSVTLILALLAVQLMVGAVEGSSPADGGTVHIVQWGENLAGIAYRYGTTVDAIVQANGLINPHLIQVGQRLVIPGSNTFTVAPSGGTYIVRRGDTLYSIAQRHGTTVDAIMLANGLSSALIYIGQELIIPAAGDLAPMAGTLNPAMTYCTVQRGDTLTTIAHRYGVMVNDIMQANNLYNPWYIYPDQQLVIPAGQMPPPTQPTSTYYTVQNGDNLTTIALRYGMTVPALVRANNLANPSFIYPGQELVIPGVAAMPMASSVLQPPGMPAASEPPSLPPPSQPPGVPPPSQQPGMPPVPQPPSAESGALEPPVVLAPPHHMPPAPQPTMMSKKPPFVTMVWKGRVVSTEDLEKPPCPDQPPHRFFLSILRVSVNGVKGQAVKVTEPLTQWSTTGLTGTKPEYGEYACEFAPLNEGTYVVSLPGLEASLSIDIEPHSLTYIEFNKVMADTL